MTDSCSVRPVISRNSSTLSNVPESLQSGSTIGKQLVQLVAKQLAFDDALAGLHPIRVAAERVDFAVVAHEAHSAGRGPTRGTCWSKTANGPSPDGSCSRATPGRGNT